MALRENNKNVWKLYAVKLPKQSFICIREAPFCTEKSLTMSVSSKTIQIHWNSFYSIYWFYFLVESIFVTPLSINIANINGNFFTYITNYIFVYCGKIRTRPETPSIIKKWIKKKINKNGNRLSHCWQRDVNDEGTFEQKFDAVGNFCGVISYKIFFTLYIISWEYNVTIVLHRSYCEQPVWCCGSTGVLNNWLLG